MSSPSAPLSPKSPKAPRERPLRSGYVASLVCAAVTLVVFGILLVLGPWVRHPTPDFISEVGRNLEVRLDVEEEDIGELGVYGLTFEGFCTVTTPSGARGESHRQGTSGYDFGAEEWDLVQTLEITETGTHDIVCENPDTEFGIASKDVVENAGMRQGLWTLTRIGLPILGLFATVTIAMVTRMRDRQEKAAMPQSH
ncbi:hypothetical protein [Nocardiopsis listeri]|uniref:hypothetical protein n=1 Tax=Nocardiopsis listeri TaxID=53440 RepID=UPI001CC1F951|nr:hypothetical protein [Nocardiopsis listeri]